MILEIIQWTALVALFASRTVLKSRVAALEERFTLLQQVEDLVPDCEFCVSEKWGPREELISGQWIHCNEKGLIKFCLRPVKPPP